MRSVAATPLRDLTRSQVRATEVVDVEPLVTSGGHETFTGRLADSGQPVFIKHALVKTVVGGPLDPCMLRTMRALFPHLDRYQDMTETMLSHAVSHYFTSQDRPYSGITYNEVISRDRKVLGIAAPLVDHLGTLTDVPAKDVSNAKDAVEGTLLRGMLLGDFDVMFNTENTAVVQADGRMSDGTPIRKGQALLMDFGEGGHKGISFLGVPYGSRALLAEYPQYIKPAMDNILRLDRHQIRQMVEAGGQHVTGWNESLTDHFTDILASNLDRMRERWQKNPQWFEAGRSKNPLATGRLAEAMQDTRGFLNYIGLRASGVLHGIPDNRAVAETIGSLLSTVPQSRQEITVS